MGTVPQHVAVIMDGNGRWAKKRLLPRTAGHKAAIGRIRDLVSHSAKAGVKALTLYAFSSENWRRPQGEVSAIMSLMMTSLSKEVASLHENQVRLRFIGERDTLSDKMRDGMVQAEQLTAQNTGLNLNIAFNYGAHWELTEATRHIAQQVRQGELLLEAITPELLAQHLTMPDWPAVDLFIRTGGEQRISNYLLWQLAYAELYFTATYFPAFNTAAYQQALDWFAGRERRFGQTSEQLQVELT